MLSNMGHTERYCALAESSTVSLGRWEELAAFVPKHFSIPARVLGLVMLGSSKHVSYECACILITLSNTYADIVSWLRSPLKASLDRGMHIPNWFGKVSDSRDWGSITGKEENQYKSAFSSWCWGSLLTRVLQRSRTKRFTIRNWLVRLWRLGSPKSAVLASRLETPESWWYRRSLKASCWRTPSASGSSVSVPFKASTDWMRPTHTMEGTLLYPKSTILMLISSKNTLQIDM